MDRVGRDQRSRLQGRDQRSRLQGRDRRPDARVARAGDAWILGPHRLLCGDAADAAALSAIDAAIRRWQSVTGDSARLHSSGERFDEVARARRAATLPPSRGKVSLRSNDR